MNIYGLNINYRVFDGLSMELHEKAVNLGKELKSKFLSCATAHEFETVCGPIEREIYRQDKIDHDAINIASFPDLQINKWAFREALMGSADKKLQEGKIDLAWAINKKINLYQDEDVTRAQKISDKFLENGFPEKALNVATYYYSQAHGLLNNQNFYDTRSKFFNEGDICLQKTMDWASQHEENFDDIAEVCKQNMKSFSHKYLDEAIQKNKDKLQVV
jgi:hypothetical protein